MTREINSCVVPGGQLSVKQAQETIAASIVPIAGSVQLPLRDALQRVLVGDVISSIDVPAHTNSAMDGYAVRFADLQADGESELTLAGSAFAGQPYQPSVNPGECVRIMTGAKLPANTDTVIMQEDVQVRGQTIHFGPGHRQGQHVRMAGEDLAHGDRVLEQGRLLTPSDIGLLASLGHAEVRVKPRLRVAFFSTGDELRSIGEALGEGEIYDSNRYTLHGMLQHPAIEVLDLGVVRDRRETVREAFEHASALADAVITSGGVSVGEADYVKETLDALGEVNFWKVAMKPGRPLAFGKVGQAYFFGLPGNPVSVMVTFRQFVRAALLCLMGAHAIEPLRLRLRTLNALRKAPGRSEFQRAIMQTDSESGETVVVSTGQQGSGILSSMSRANCFIVLPDDCGNVAAGEQVEVEPFPSGF